MRRKGLRVRGRRIRRSSVFKGPDQIELYYFGRGHTNGDAWVVFPSLRMMHAGDMPTNKVRRSTELFAREVMPNGMLGLLICCIFAASLTGDLLMIAA